MELKDSVVILQSGSAVSGLSVTWRKYGESTGGIDATETYAGKYEATIPDTYISKYYQVVITGGAFNPYIVKDFIAPWQWAIEDYEATDGDTISFSSLTDNAGDTLPSTIPNPTITIIPKTDRLGYTYNITNTDFEIHLSKAGGGTGTFDIIIGLAEA